MKYTGISCVFCARPFSETDDVVVCPVCGAPHHRACWQQHGRCACEAAHASGFTWASPVQPEPEKPEKEVRFKNGEGVVVCPNCGTENFENDMYCLRCGAKLHDDSGARVYHPYDETQTGFQRQELINDFNRFGGLDPNSLVDGVPVCEYSDYVGGGTPGRIIRKVSGSERYGRKVVWHAPAFFFGPIWFFFRKMKKEGLLLSLVLILLAAAVGILQINDAFVDYVKGTMEATLSVMNGEADIETYRDTLYTLAETYQTTVLTGADAVKERVGSLLQYVIMIGSPLFSGLFGIYFYRKHVRREIEKIRERCTDLPSYRATLQHEGGTSAGLAVIGVVLALAAFFCMDYLPALIALLR